MLRAATLYGSAWVIPFRRLQPIPGWYAWSIVTALPVILASGLGRRPSRWLPCGFDRHLRVVRLTPFTQGVDRTTRVLRFPKL